MVVFNDNLNKCSKKRLEKLVIIYFVDLKLKNNFWNNFLIDYLGVSVL